MTPDELAVIDFLTRHDRPETRETVGRLREALRTGNDKDGLVTLVASFRKRARSAFDVGSVNRLLSGVGLASPVSFRLPGASLKVASTEAQSDPPSARGENDPPIFHLLRRLASLAEDGAPGPNEDFLLKFLRQLLEEDPHDLSRSGPRDLSLWENLLSTVVLRVEAGETGPDDVLALTTVAEADLTPKTTADLMELLHTLLYDVVKDDRTREILQFKLEGYSDQEIASEKLVSHHTVQLEIQQALEELREHQRRVG